MSGFADNDETVDIIKIPAGVADTGVCNPELTVYIALFPGRIAEKQTVQCAGTGDKCVGAEDRDKRAGGKSHMKFQTALVISDLDTDKSAVFSLFSVIVFVKIRNKTFVCRQNGHFLFGVFYSIVVNFQYMIKKAETEVCVTVFFDENLSETDIKKLGDEISKREEVSRVQYVSADDAWESFKGEYFAAYPELAEGFKDDNPLANSSSYEVYLKDASNQGTLVKYLENKDGIRQVNRSEVTASGLASAARLVSYVAVAVIVVLLAVSIFLITNTIVIGITVRKDEISIMKYIGATDAFVNAPFFVEGIVIGLIGAIIPVAILRYIYGGVVNFVLGKFSVLQNILAFMPASEVFEVLIPVAVILGIGIGLIGSFFAVRKHADV